MFQDMVVKSCDELTIGTGASKLATNIAHRC